MFSKVCQCSLGVYQRCAQQPQRVSTHKQCTGEAGKRALAGLTRAQPAHDTATRHLELGCTLANQTSTNGRTWEPLGAHPRLHRVARQHRPRPGPPTKLPRTFLNVSSCRPLRAMFLHRFRGPAYLGPELRAAPTCRVEAGLAPSLGHFPEEAPRALTLFGGLLLGSVGLRCSLPAQQSCTSQLKTTQTRLAAAKWTSHSQRQPNGLATFTKCRRPTVLKTTRQS